MVVREGLEVGLLAVVYRNFEIEVFVKLWGTCTLKQPLTLI